MAQTRLTAALALAKKHGIQIDMIDEYMSDQIVVRGRLGDGVYERRINRSSAFQTKDLDLLYADAHYMVIDELLQGSRRNNSDHHRVAELERELAKYKAAVKDLSFKLEMASTGRAVVKEFEVRKFALEQAAEFLMDHGVITTGNELVEVCEQIKKLSVVQANAGPVERWNDWKF
jgi:hypothetical protein